MSTLTSGGFVGGGVLAFLAFAAFWAKSGELRARRQRRKTRRMGCERDAAVVIACCDVDFVLNGAKTESIGRRMGAEE
jgi:hypothetical protein